jgi:hypothetical protein
VQYELLAGRRPFAGKTDLEVLQTIIHGAAPLLPEAVPPGLRSIVEKALEKDPEERYQSVGEMVVDLRRLVRQSGEPAQPPSRWHWAWAALAAGCGFLWLAGVASAEARRVVARRPAHHPARSAALSLVFPRRQPRGIFVDRAQTRQPGYLCATDRRQRSATTHYRPS